MSTISSVADSVCIVVDGDQIGVLLDSISISMLIRTMTGSADLSVFSVFVFARVLYRYLLHGKRLSVLVNPNLSMRNCSAFVK